MKRIAALFAALLAASIAPPAQAQDCKLQMAASLRSVIGPGGLLLVPVTVSGKQILMLLDTGASRGVLDATLASGLGLAARKLSTPQPIFAIPRQPLRGFQTFPTQQYYLASGAKLNTMSIVPSLDIGGVHATNVSFMLAAINDAALPPLKGILGNDQLGGFDLEIDPARGLVNLFSQDHCEGKVVYWTDRYSDMPIKVSMDGQIELAMTLDGHEVDTVLDTGAASTTLSLQIARQVFGVDTDGPGVEKVSGEGRNTVYRTRFKSLTAGGISIPSPQILLVRDALADRLREEAADSRHLMPILPRTPQLVLGMDVLRELHLYIAYKERKLYVTAAGADGAAKP